MKIKKFNENSNQLTKVWYIDLFDLQDALDKEAIDEWTNDHPHNNGYAVLWEVIAPTDSGYPKFDEYFLNNGIGIGENVLVHSTW